MANRRQKEVEDGLLRLRNLRRFGAMAQHGEGGWGGRHSAWSTLQVSFFNGRILISYSRILICYQES